MALPQVVERWTAKRRASLVVSILKGETRRHGLRVAEVEGWKERYELAAENALRARPRNEDALKNEEIKKLKQKVGELVIDNDILKEGLKLMNRPFDEETSEE